MKVLHLYLYGEIAPDAQDPRLWGGPQIFGTNWLVSALNSMPEAEELIVHINSPGGDVVEGFAIHDILVTTGKKVTTIVEGRAASIATIVTLAGSVRKITKNSTFLIHNPWQDGWIGDADHFRKVADGLETVENVIANFYSENTNQPVDTLLAYMKEEKEFTADEALAMGFFTEVIAPTENKQPDTKAKAYLTNINDMSKPNLMQRLDAAMKAFKGSIKNADFATADGKTLQIETAGTEPAAGDSVSVDGQPAADGEYKLADGKTLVVAAGKITEVKPAEAPAAANAQPAANAETTQVLNAIVESVTTLSGTVQNLQLTLQGMQNSQKEVNEVLEGVTASVELIGTTMQSEGFKKVLNKNKFNEDGAEGRAKNAETQKQNAIAKVRERAKLHQAGKGKLNIKKDGKENEEAE